MFKSIFKKTSQNIKLSTGLLLKQEKKLPDITRFSKCILRKFQSNGAACIGRAGGKNKYASLLKTLNFFNYKQYWLNVLTFIEKLKPNSSGHWQWKKWTILDAWECCNTWCLCPNDDKKSNYLASTETFLQC